eukprot:TRINITY_DN14367_c0_g1_i1.p1 TRINITY_DN14367_c0_g1~~TRINITY_DN14367_c0_g1_i1.p1  ORF type:complete len:350 (+),score=80.56 TRINITY_DN14367_c0_g1_i1:38-1051(+)
MSLWEKRQVTGQGETIEVLVFGPVVAPGTTVAPRSLPLAVFAHGWLSTADIYTKLLCRVASQGVLFVAINSYSNMFPSHTGYAAAILTCLKWGITQYSEIVDTQRLHLCGHSMGGGASLLAATMVGTHGILPPVSAPTTQSAATAPPSAATAPPAASATPAAATATGSGTATATAATTTASTVAATSATTTTATATTTTLAGGPPATVALPPRLCTVTSMAPIDTNPSMLPKLRSVGMSVLIVEATNDTIVPALKGPTLIWENLITKPEAAAGGKRYYVKLQGGTHTGFIDSVTWMASLFDGKPGITNEVQIERSATLLQQHILGTHSLVENTITQI